MYFVHRNDSVPHILDVSITSTYQASIGGLAKRGLDETASLNLMKKAVQLAHAAREKAWSDILSTGNPSNRLKPLVAASIGCYGAALADGSEYTGNYGKEGGLSIQQLIDWHRPRMVGAFFLIVVVVAALLLQFLYMICFFVGGINQAALASCPESDILACETIPCVREAVSVIRLAKTEFPGMPLWVSLCLRDGSHLQVIIPMDRRILNPHRNTATLPRLLVYTHQEWGEAGGLSQRHCCRTKGIGQWQHHWCVSSCGGCELHSPCTCARSNQGDQKSC
jgi:hypothetical protein